MPAGVGNRPPILALDRRPVGRGEGLWRALTQGGYTTVSARRPFLIRAYAPLRDCAGLIQGEVPWLPGDAAGGFRESCMPAWLRSRSESGPAAERSDV